MFYVTTEKHSITASIVLCESSDFNDVRIRSILWPGIITFAFACCLAFTVCIGLSVAIITGVAYGYNYLMAEFITFTRSDVTVYMRRGQWADKRFGDLPRDPERRSGDSVDLFAQNSSADYDTMIAGRGSKPLSDTWVKNQESRKYAERLTKYSYVDKPVSERFSKSEELNRLKEPVITYSNTTQPYVSYGYFELTSPPSHRFSVVPNMLELTTLLRSGSSQILMREFIPHDVPTLRPVVKQEEYNNDDLPLERKTIDIRNFMPIESTESSLEEEGLPMERSTLLYREEFRRRESSKKMHIPMRNWGSQPAPAVGDYPAYEHEEDGIVYKPV